MNHSTSALLSHYWPPTKEIINPRWRKIKLSGHPPPPPPLLLILPPPLHLSVIIIFWYFAEISHKRSTGYPNVFVAISNNSNVLLSPQIINESKSTTTNVFSLAAYNLTHFNYMFLATKYRIIRLYNSHNNNIYVMKDVRDYVLFMI